MTQKRKKTFCFSFFSIFVTFARFGKVNSDAFVAAHLFQFRIFWLFEGFCWIVSLLKALASSKWTAN
jgi:hypothetical protein